MEVNKEPCKDFEGVVSRPEHLNVPNTPEGIRRINERQEAYDADPDRREMEQEALDQERQEQEDRERFEQEQAEQEAYERDVEYENEQGDF